jgi:hypothetical protein
MLWELFIHSQHRSPNHPFKPIRWDKEFIGDEFALEVGARAIGEHTGRDQFHLKVGIVYVIVIGPVDIRIIRTDIVQTVGQEDQIIEVIVFWDEAFGDDVFARPFDMTAREICTWEPVFFHNPPARLETCRIEHIEQ